MNKDELLAAVDVWCQWEHIFGEHAKELHAYFSVREPLLRKILRLFLEARKEEPTKKWWGQWTVLREELDEEMVRPFLLGIVAKREWYRGVASEVDMQMIKKKEEKEERGIDTAGGVQIHGNSAWLTNGGEQQWYRKEGVWYKRFSSGLLSRLKRISCGAAFAFVEFADDEVGKVLFECVKLRNMAAIWSLLRTGNTKYLAMLDKWAKKTAHAKTKQCLEKQVEVLAEERGVSTAAIWDSMVYTYGLNEDGMRTWQMGSYSVQLALNGGRVQRVFYDGEGKKCRVLPSVVEEEHHELLQRIKEEAKLLAETFALQKKRLLDVMVQGIAWSFETWWKSMTNNPIMRYWAGRLLWKVMSGDGVVYMMPDSDMEWRDVDGRVVEIPVGCSIQLAHPVEMSVDEIAGWRRVIVKRKLVQPFKQVFRETYVLTPAEEETRTYSLRLAAHVVDETLSIPGWLNNYYNCQRAFPRHQVLAYIWHHRKRYRGQVVALTGEVVFYPLKHNNLYTKPDFALDRACIPLEQIDPRIFSEAMYDIDQFLHSHSLGISESQLESEEAYRYRQSDDYKRTGLSFTEIVSKRAQLIQELLPGLGLSESVKVSKNNVSVEGQLHRYRIELATGSVFIEPQGRYLCIVSGRSPKHLYLPFEESDVRTTEILSKILLLVDDQLIKDRTIVSQF